VCRWTLIVYACVVYLSIYLLLVGRYMGRGLKAAVAGSREHTHNLPLVANVQTYQVRTSDGEWRACNVTGGVYSSCDHDYLDGDKLFVAVADTGPCAGYGSCRGDITCQGGYKSSGGEFRLCERLVSMVNHLGYDVLFFNEIEFATEYFQQLYIRDKPRIAVVHKGTRMIPSAADKDGVNRPLSPFSEQCMLGAHYWGAKSYKNFKLWPGGFSRFVTPFPVAGNTYVGSKVDLCQRDDLHPHGDGYAPKEDLSVPVSVDRSTRQLIIDNQGEPYAVLIGKWGGTGRINRIHDTFKNNSMVWDYITHQTNLVVLQCPDEFLAATNTVERNFICLPQDSEFRKTKYKSLVKNAQFLLGIGSPLLSPSPLEALSCSVPVILTTGMHPYVDSHVPKPAAFIVETEEEVKQAVDSILSSKNITISLLKEKSRDALYQLDEHVREPELKSLLEDVQAVCTKQMEIGFYLSENDMPSLTV